MTKDVLVRAAHLTAFEGPAAVRVADLPDPTAGPGEVLVRVLAAGVGPWDLAVAAGAFGPQGGFPVVLGADVVGEVAALGEDVEGIEPGQRVMAFAGFSGAWAELQAVPVGALAPAPTSVSALEAAALPVCASTAHQAVVDGLSAGSGSTLVVLGAGGVVGSFAVQLAAGRGARVLGTASPKDDARLVGHGAEAVVDYRGDWVADLQALLPQGADAVLDLVGGPTTAAAFALLRDGGAMVSTVLGPEPTPPRDIRWSFQGTLGEPDRLREIAALVDGGQLKIELASTFPLAEAAAALAAVGGPHPPGKLVIDLA